MDIAPKPRPGYKSPDLAPSEKLPMIAHIARGIVGLVCLAAATLYMPASFVTPVLSGVSCVMIVTGALGAWRVGRRDPSLKTISRFTVWALPIATVVIFVLVAVVGAGGFGPDWSQLGAQ